MLPDCFVSESPDREELWVDELIERIDNFIAVGDWNILTDVGKRSVSSSSSSSSPYSSSSSSSSLIPDIDSTTSIEDLFSGKYLPKGILSHDAIWLQNQQIKTETVTTSFRYSRHMHTIQIPFKCPLDDDFKSNNKRTLLNFKKILYLI